MRNIIFAFYALSLILSNPLFAQGKHHTISHYFEKKIKAHRIEENDSLSHVYFKDSIMHISCTGHLPSELEIINLDTLKIEDAFDKLAMSKPAFVINNQVYYTQNSIPDFKLLAPSYLSYFSFSGNNYLAVNLNLISYIGMTGWVCVILKLDNDNHAIYDFVFDGRKPFRLSELTSLTDKLKY